MSVREARKDHLVVKRESARGNEPTFKRKKENKTSSYNNGCEQSGKLNNKQKYTNLKVN